MGIILREDINTKHQRQASKKSAVKVEVTLPRGLTKVKHSQWKIKQLKKKTIITPIV